MSASARTLIPKMPIFRRLLRNWVWPYRRLILINFILIVGVSLSTAAYPLLIKWAIDNFEGRDFDTLIYLPVLVVLITALKGATLYGHTTLTNKIASLVVRDLQNAAFKSLNRADFMQVTREAPAAIAQRFYAEMAYIQVAVARMMTSLVRDSLMLITLCAVMFYMDWQLALAGLLILPVAALPVAEVGKRLRRNALEAQSKIGGMTSFLTEALSGARLIRTYQLEEYMGERGQHVFDTLHTLRLRAANLFARVEPILEILGGLAIAIVLMLIGWRISTGTSSLGQFAGFITTLLTAAQPMRTLGNVNAVLEEGFAAAERVFALVDMAPQITDKAGAQPLQIDKAGIRFESVHFNYPDGTSALKGVSFEVPGGAMVALVGRSGAGKSTVFNLVSRLFDVSEGRVTIDGQDVREHSLHSVRSSVALVSQDVVIFQDSVRSNIALGQLDASDQQITNAAQAAAAEAFITRLPQGYDTILGEGSTLLSGGERQRISLARALVRTAPILLLDEATSALDAESEHLVQQALARLTKNCTTLVIAHRLATIRSADLIIVMDHGQVVESGTHDDLLKKQGFYAQMHSRQFREPETGDPIPA